MDRAFDITYNNDRFGAPCIKSHRFIAESREKAIEGLRFWKGSKPEDIISIEDKGEFVSNTNFTFKW